MDVFIIVIKIKLFIINMMGQYDGATWWGNMMGQYDGAT